jgi:AraC-like DNA-binding protein
MHHPRLLVETAMEQGAQLDALLEGSEVNRMMLSSPDARISYVQFGTIAGNALRLTRNPGLGIDFGRHINPSNLGMLGVAVTNSPDMRTALQIGLKYSRLLAPAWDLSLEVEGDRGVFTARDSIALNPLKAFATEALLFAMDSLVRFLQGRPANLLEVRLDYPEPAHSARYQEFCTAPIYYDQEVTEVVFDASSLDEPITTADPLTARLAERYCAEQLPSTVPVSGLVGEVRRLLYAASGSYMGPVEIAKALRTSPRTLRRGLRDMGTSYRALLDEARRAHAVEYVLCTEMRSERIAGLLGFSDVRSFRRAFRRWTGNTPAGYRIAENGQPKGR